MKLADLSTKAFTDSLASASPAPGGGAAAAFMGAQGAALVAMVAGLTAGREKYAAYDELAREVLGKANVVKEKLLLAMDKDYQAYKSVTDVYLMPKDTEEEKANHKVAMQSALKACTLTPYETMVYAAQGIELACTLMGRSNTNAACDLGVAVLNLKAALDGAWFNVQINLRGIEDEQFAAHYKGLGEDLRSTSIPLFEEVVGWVTSYF